MLVNQMAFLICNKLVMFSRDCWFGDTLYGVLVCRKKYSGYEGNRFTLEKLEILKRVNVEKALWLKCE